MSSQLKLVDDPLRATADRHGSTTTWASLVLAICSGLVGILGEPQNNIFDSAAAPLAFTVGLALYTASRFVVIAKDSAAGSDVKNARRSMRVACRQIYLLLYGLFAAKEIQFFLSTPGGGPAPAKVMHGLWPYLAGALVSLALARILAWRTWE